MTDQAGTPIGGVSAWRKECFMGRSRFIYHINGYRYAPESFRIYKHLPGRPPKELLLPFEQQSWMGYLYITQGCQKAIAYAKHKERQQEKKCMSYMTYGFMFRDEQRRYAYFPQLYCKADASLPDRLELFRSIREQLRFMGGQIEEYTSCELDGRYRPINIEKHYKIVDLSRPVVVRLRSA